MGHLQYLAVLVACLVVTLPLELVLGARVYRQPAKAVKAVAVGAAPFVGWDGYASIAGTWSFNPAYVVGLRPVFGLPLEELLFFVVVPVCALLTFEASDRVITAWAGHNG